MAVFPSARRALGRPARLPWLIAAAALITVTLSIPAVSLLRDAASGVESPHLVSDTSSTSVEGAPVRPGRLTPADGAARAGRPFLTREQENALAIATASDVLMAAEEAAYATLQPIAAADDAASTGTIAEVGEAAAVTVLVASVADTVVPSAADVTTVAPASDTRAPVTAAAPAQPEPVPAQSIPATAAGPVERWAAAGIVIETEGQALDDASLANVDAALSALPAGVLSSLGNPAFGPLRILVNTEGRVLSGDQPYRGPANFFSTNEATNELVLYPRQSVFTIVHELGHAYNLRRIGAGRYAMVLLDPEMRSFLMATGWQITSTDEQIRGAVDHMHVSYTYSGSFHWPRMSNDDPLEDFANSFAMYFLDPVTLQQASPERYAWMAATFGR